MLEVIECRWGSFVEDPIVGFPRLKNIFDAATTLVDRLSRSGHFAKSKSTDTTVHFADAFLENILALRFSRRYHTRS